MTNSMMTTEIRRFLFRNRHHELLVVVSCSAGGPSTLGALRFLQGLGRERARAAELRLRRGHYKEGGDLLSGETRDRQLQGSPHD